MTGVRILGAPREAQAPESTEGPALVAEQHTESQNSAEKRGTVQPNQYQNYPSNTAYGQPTSQPAQAQQAQFADPQAGGGSALKVRHLEGRHCIFVPTGYNPTAKGMNPTDPPRPTVTADVVVLDGGELYFGDNAANHTPMTQKVTVPFYAPGLLIGNSEIVRALVDSVGRQIVLGKVVKGTQGNRPFLLERLEANDPARELAAQVWQARSLGSFVNPTPVPLMPQGAPAGQPAQYAQAMSFNAPANAPQARGYAYPQGAPGQPVQYGQPSQAPAAYAPAQGAPVGHQPMVQQVQTPAASDVPPGWNLEAWNGLPEAQRNAIRAAQAQQYGTTAPAAAMSGPTGF